MSGVTMREAASADSLSSRTGRPEPWPVADGHAAEGICDGKRSDVSRFRSAPRLPGVRPSDWPSSAETGTPAEGEIIVAAFLRRRRGRDRVESVPKPVAAVEQIEADRAGKRSG